MKIGLCDTIRTIWNDIPSENLIIFQFLQLSLTEARRSWFNWCVGKRKRAERIQINRHFACLQLWNDYEHEIKQNRILHFTISVSKSRVDGLRCWYSWHVARSNEMWLHFRQQQNNWHTLLKYTTENAKDLIFFSNMSAWNGFTNKWCLNSC